MPTASPAAPGGRATYLRVLAVGEFRALLAAEVLSVLALVAVQITLSVLVFDRTGSPLLSALAFALGFAPQLVGAALLSAVTDRYPARSLMTAAQAANAVLVAAMALPGAPVPAMLGLLAVTGLVAPVYQGCRSAAVADVLAGDGFPLGRSLLRMAAQTAQIAGFAFGGTLLLVLRPQTVLAVAAAMMAAAGLLVLVGTAARPARQGPGGRVVGASLAGVGRALRVPRLRAVLLLMWLPPALMVWPEALAAPLADGMGGGPVLVGLLLSAGPVGTVAGELLAGTVLDAGQRRRWMVPLALAAFAPFPVFAMGPGPAVAVALLGAGALGFGYTLALDALLLEEAPEEMRGRVFTLASAGLMITQGVGFAAAGAVAEAVPPHLAVAVAGVCGIAVVLAAGRPFVRPA
ncbi:MFS transporter [Nocardiopsis sp. RSe5-2]|uniref:MFS transporter n=1 Tax=Nocardiopsis endophytica TaxID=3018445 RepID=A0ABT4UA46_9ACTN|nr:MFS transporter [Nocardiopsis endophytica]MDA2813823.1 MFS transporter [Nocardiopsis endophytica]